MSSSGGDSLAVPGVGRLPRPVGRRGLARRRGAAAPRNHRTGRSRSMCSDGLTASPDNSDCPSTPRAPSPVPSGAGDRAFAPPPLARSPTSGASVLPSPTCTPHARSCSPSPPPSSSAGAADAADEHRCPIASCGATAAGNPLWLAVRAHLRHAHKAADGVGAVGQLAARLPPLRRLASFRSVDDRAPGAGGARGGVSCAPGRACCRAGGPRGCELAGGGWRRGRVGRCHAGALSWR